MELQEYIERMKDIQQILLNYIDNGDEEEYNSLIKLLSKSNVVENRNGLKSIIQLVASIADNHRRSPDFFPRIKRILNQYKEEIRQTFSNSEIYNFFHLNKTLLLFLLQEKLILPENLLKNEDSYLAFFYPEIESKIDEDKKSSLFEDFEELRQNYSSEEFDQKRQIGENDSYICSLIRNDSVEEFIHYVNKQNLSLSNAKIKSSIFETNLFLIKQNEISMIEYATFFGSFQIIQYLRVNKVNINSKIWLYAIHGSNVEMIQTLEENKIKPEDSKYADNTSLMQAMIFLHPFFHYANDEDIPNYSLDLCLKAAIKCHHNEICDYIKDKSLDHLLKKEEENNNNSDDDDNDDDKNRESIKRNIVGSIFKNRNYHCFPNDIDKKLMLFYFCKYDYVTPVELILKSDEVNVNEIIIQN